MNLLIFNLFYYIFQLFGEDFNMVTDVLNDDANSNYAIINQSEIKNQNNTNLVKDYQV